MRRRLPLPKGVVPEPRYEVDPFSEAVLTELIERFEHGWLARGKAPRDRRNWGSCNIVPDVFGFVVQDEARRRGSELEVRKHQLKELHSAAGGPPEFAFQHGFNTVTVDRRAFLVDLTFSQFLGRNGTLQMGPRGSSEMYSSGVSNDNPLAQELIGRGFVALTNENLREYLRITTRADDRSYVATAEVQILEHATPIPIVLNAADGIDENFGRLTTP